MPRVDYALSPEQRADARRALKRLDGCMTLEEAAIRAMRGVQAVDRISLDDAVELFIASRVSEKRRQATIEFYEMFLAPVQKVLGGEIMDTIDAKRLATVVIAATKGETARTSIARACRALWRWGMSRAEPIVAIDVTKGLRFVPVRPEGREPTVLTVEQCGQILRGAGRHRSALALMLYAGVRPEEIHGPNKPPMRWRHISIAEECITVPAECAKTRRRRDIQGLPASIWQWLEPGKPDDPISTGRSRAIISTAKDLTGHGPKNRWPQDATRHTFASYMLALTGDASRVAMWLGHGENPRMLLTHYYRPGLKAAAPAFLALCNEGAACPWWKGARGPQ